MKATYCNNHTPYFTTSNTVSLTVIILALNTLLNTLSAQNNGAPLQLAPGYDFQNVVVFSARSPRIQPLSPGHAFVSFAKTNNDLETCVTATYGFYPCEGCSVFTDEQPGRVVKGYTKNRSGNKHLRRMAIKTDSIYITATDAVLEKWQKTQYNLVRRNCVRFASEVAAAQGLITPSTTYWGIFPKLPKKYIRQLEKANPGRVILLPAFNKEGIPDCLDENQNGIPDGTEVVHTEE